MTSWSDGLAGASLPILVGPTAVGKTAVAVALAALLPLEVISADSRQIYRRLDIGTAKPSRRERLRVPHHGVDLVEPGERYSAGRFAREATGWIEEVRARGRLPVVVGGTGLYVRALADGLFVEPPLDVERRRSLQHWIAGLAAFDLVRWAGRLDPGFAGGGRQRASRAIEIALLTGHPLSAWHALASGEGAVSPWYVRLTAPRPVLHQRIRVRAEEMVRRGLIEEVASVLSEGHPAGAPGLDGVGIREAVEYLHGHRSRESVAEAVATGTRGYAKRQETWFRHQLRGPVLTLDASRPAEELAAEIAAAWQGGRPLLHV
ncbi:MAG: tRNA (adenosine(37)-N6)-dimethylallyltransferase MiaA [Gemmatimonadetes bacterium]|nr:MAG: tRNA (adenosine(37)-N6)-dimethylallyltransferase MiaA [Gemmatimonadota bacterium]